MSTWAFLDHPGPIAFAHRGGAHDGPENTMSAFANAVALGYRYIETDVHVTADGVLVAFHDDGLDRVTDSRGKISHLSMAQIREADAGHWFTRDHGETYPYRGKGVQVPTLEELLVRWRHVRINVDPKEDVAIGPLAALLHRLEAIDRVCVGSFSDRRLIRIRGLTRGRVCTSMGRNGVSMAWLSSRVGRMARLDADCLQVPLRWGDFRLVDSRFLAAAHRADLPVHVWTVDDEATINELLDLGVDGIMTDQPQTLRRVLIERGQWHEVSRTNSATAQAGR